MDIKKIAFVLFFSFILTSCAPVDTMTAKYASHQPYPYSKGFRDGCSSGYVAAGHVYASFEKDLELFQTSETYKTGWQDGFNVCKGNYDNTQRSFQ